MPILVPPSGYVAPTAPAEGAYSPPQYQTPLWQWTSPTGRIRNLSADHPYLRPGGITGHMAPPISVLESRPPTLDGGVWRGQQYLPREMALGVMAHTRESHVWRSTYRQVVEDFDTSTGVGVLTVSYPDGASRSVQARYITGLESPIEGEPGVVRIGTFLIQLRAYDPWWYGSPQSRAFTPQADADFVPGPPFTIMPTELAGSPSTVNNIGDVPAYPVWTIHGPASQVEFENDSGESFTVTSSIGLGEWVRIDTDPRVALDSKIVDHNGDNLWGVATNDYPNLWALPAGESQVTVSVSGSSADSQIIMQWNPRYRTA